MDQLGVDLVQTSAHIGARPEHQVWQGQVFSRNGASSKYPPFVESTGYGTGPGLGGWNCRHSFYPFFDGISPNAYNQATLDSYAGKTVTYNGKELSVYDATQKQRYIERGIRHWKRQADALDSAGLDAEFENAKVREWQGRMREFTRQTGLSRQRERERIFGAGAPPPKVAAVPSKPVVPPQGTIPAPLDLSNITKGTTPTSQLIEEPEFFDWEVKEFRRTISTRLDGIHENPYKTVVVPRNVYEKIVTDHVMDLPYLPRIDEVIDNWAYVGISPKDPAKIEFYKLMDDIWFTAILKKDEGVLAYILTTFHRIYRRKMESRIAKGYLIVK